MKEQTSKIQIYRKRKTIVHMKITRPTLNQLKIVNYLKNSPKCPVKTRTVVTSQLGVASVPKNHLHTWSLLKIDGHLNRNLT